VEQEQPDDLAVAINTDLPVHRSLVGQRAADAYQSPFINLTSLVPSDDVEDLTTWIHRMRFLRVEAYPHLRRAAAAFARGDVANVQFILKQALVVTALTSRRRILSTSSAARSPTSTALSKTLVHACAPRRSGRA
jgi:hypothetical protein